MKNKGSFVAAGDLFITRKLPQNGYEGMKELVDFIGQQDIRFVNLEVTVHDREGYPFGFSGGTWAMAHPSLLKDVKRYGFNIYNNANNHSMDYSHNGLMATMDYLKHEDMNYAGVGENLADAGAPVYIEGTNIRAAVIAATSTFHESWAAGNQRLDMKGRPGVNPLRFRNKFHVKQESYEMLKKLADEIDINAQQNLDVKEGFAVEAKDSFKFGGHEFYPDTENFKETVPSDADVKRITESIKEAKKQSDYVMVSIHSHEMSGEDKEKPAQFLQIFAKACIDAGASVVLGHGPHILRGIELYKGGIIFYSLGNFLFENDTTTHQPSDFYEKYHMSNTSMVGEGMDNRSKGGTIGLSVNPDVWRSVIARWEVEDGTVTELKLYPIHMGMELPRYRKGLPAFAEDDGLLDHLAELSAEFGTEIRIENHIGVVTLQKKG